ncbi:MAG: PAS domain-containing protein [Afipia sp.]|nr:PAS domain-containing protein [Afipia sp.]
METAAKIYSSIMFPGVAAEAEPHFSEIQKRMLDATPDCIKVLSPDGRLLAMNKAGCLALNVPEDSEFGMPWLPLLPESVHELGQKALQTAIGGHNARFPGMSISSDGLRYWDNLLNPFVDASGNVLSILCVSRDVTATTELKQKLAAAVNREQLLSREMQHRIKNLFAVVSGLVSIAEREAARDHTPQDAMNILRQKIGALSRASDAALPHDENETLEANQLTMLALVSSVLRPYGEQCKVAGDEVHVSRSSITTIALLLHEQATNSMKYGALGGSQGIVSVRWAADSQGINLNWTENGGPAISSVPQRQGFGSEMVDRIIQAAGGRVDRTWDRAGVIIDLYLPESFMA